MLNIVDEGSEEVQPKDQNQIWSDKLFHPDSHILGDYMSRWSLSELWLVFVLCNLPNLFDYTDLLFVFKIWIVKYVDLNKPLPNKVNRLLMALSYSSLCPWRGSFQHHHLSTATSRNPPDPNTSTMCTEHWLWLPRSQLKTVGAGFRQRDTDDSHEEGNM